MDFLGSLGLVPNDLGETHDLQNIDQVQFTKMKTSLDQWEHAMKKPLWTEGAVWDTITLMIHDDLYNNRPVRVTQPQELNKFLKAKKTF